MAKEEFTQEMYDKSIEVALKLTKVLVEEGNDNYSTTFMTFCVARFTAGILLALQKYSNEDDIASKYTNLIKKMMEDMGNYQSMQSVKNQIKESKEEIDKLNLREKDILRMIFDKKDINGN